MPTIANANDTTKAEIAAIGGLFNASHYGAAGTGYPTDDTSAIQDALDDAAAVSGVVFVPSGEYYLASTLEITQGASLMGESTLGTIFTSDYDGEIIRNAYAGAPYNNRGTFLRDFSIVGDLAETSQDGLSLLRFSTPSYIQGVEVSECGRHGVVLQECIGTFFQSTYSHDNAGSGWVLAQGFNNWTARTPNSLPTNACAFHSCTADGNDAAGLHLTSAGGNTWFGGYIQNSYAAFNGAGSHIGWNIFLGAGASGNSFHGLWVEGPCKCHIYGQNDDGALVAVNTFTDIYHSVSAGANVERLCISDKGTLVINGHSGASNVYATTTRDGVTHTTLCRCCEDDTAAWAATTAYSVGDLVENDGTNRYICTDAGTSAGSGGPTGEVIDPASATITDGTCEWIWDGIEGVGRLSVIGVKHNSTATLGNYLAIEAQDSTAPGALYASELILFTSGIASS